MERVPLEVPECVCLRTPDALDYDCTEVTERHILNLFDRHKNFILFEHRLDPKIFLSPQNAHSIFKNEEMV